VSGAALRIDAGRRSELRAGSVRLIRLPLQQNGLPQEAIVLLDAAGMLRAYVNRCQHLPIPLDGGSGRFLTADGKFLQCGTHGAIYRLEDGVCVEGPCDGRALEALELELAGDAIVLLFDPLPVPGTSRS
jgi:nitrite reductase/ring-hydroxylating ferredoxin subunit